MNKNYKCTRAATYLIVMWVLFISIELTSIYRIKVILNIQLKMDRSATTLKTFGDLNVVVDRGQHTQQP